MSARQFSVRPRIAEVMRAPGGITIAEALQRAQDALEDIRGECIAAVDDKIERLGALAQQKPMPHDELYILANEVFSEAGAFGMTEVSHAAHSLCDLLCAIEGEDARAAIGVHTDALRVLRQPDVSENAARRAAVLDGLRKVAARYLGQAKAPG